MFKVEFTDRVETINYNSKKTGKPGTITKTHGYFFKPGDKYPLNFSFVSFDGEVMSPGEYKATPFPTVENGNLVTKWKYEFIK